MRAGVPDGSEVVGGGGIQHHATHGLYYQDSHNSKPGIHCEKGTLYTLTNIPDINFPS